MESSGSTAYDRGCQKGYEDGMEHGKMVRGDRVDIEAERSYVEGYIDGLRALLERYKEDKNEIWNRII